MPTITKEILFNLIDLMLSASAHSSRDGRAAGDAWINPQPEPPSSETPHPEPWRSAAVARQVISLAALSQTAAADEESGLRTARSILGVFIDDFCSVASNRRLPLPPPWPRSGIKPNAVALLVAASQFQAVANNLKGQPISESLAECADRLLEVGLRRFSS